MEIWTKFLLAWVPLFVAIDPIGIVPIFLAMTEDAGAAYRRRIAQQAAWTAALVAVGFMFLGKAIFRALGITVADFRLQGGWYSLVWRRATCCSRAENAARGWRLWRGATGLAVDCRPRHSDDAADSSGHRGSRVHAGRVVGQSAVGGCCIALQRKVGWLGWPEWVAGDFEDRRAAAGGDRHPHDSPRAAGGVAALGEAGFVTVLRGRGESGSPRRFGEDFAKNIKGFIGAERLMDIPVDGVLLLEFTEPRFVGARADDYFDAGVEFVEPLASLATVQPRHEEVQQHDVKILAAHLVNLQGLDAVGRGRDLEALRLQQLADDA